MDKTAVFKRLAAGTSWNSVMQIKDRMCLYRLISKIIKELYSIAFPVVAIRKHQKSRKPWIDSRLLKRTKERDKLFGLFIETGKLGTLAKYKKKSEINRNKHARAAHYENMFASVSNDSKK